MLTQKLWNMALPIPQVPRRVPVHSQIEPPKQRREAEEHLAVRQVLANAHARPLGERDQPALEHGRVIRQPAVGVEGLGVVEENFTLMHEGSRHSHDDLRELAMWARNL